MKQRAKSKEHILSLRGEAEAISKSEIPRFARNDIFGMLTNEKGIALAMILVLSFIALAIMAGLIYMVTTGTQISGMQKRYETAREASKGGVDVSFQVINYRGDPGIPGINFYQTTSDLCLDAKFRTTTSSLNWSSCSDYLKATQISINPDDPATYDFRFDLGETPTYNVYSKIVDTVEGNTKGGAGELIQGGVVWAKAEFFPVRKPYIYTVEVHTENQANPNERAKFSIVYEY
jgi:hypothetical protein